MKKYLLLAGLLCASCSNEAIIDEYSGTSSEDAAELSDAQPDGVPAIDGGTYLSPQAVIDEFKNQAQWCTRYDPSSGCGGVARLNRVTANGIIISWVIGLADGGKIAYDQALTLENGMLCEDHSDGLFLNTLNIYRSTNTDAKISGDDQSIRYLPDGSRFPGWDNMKQDMAQAIASGAQETCWAYYVSDNPSDGLANEILMVNFADGIEQPVDPDSRGAFFGEDSQLRLKRE